jgi:glycogen operon protein
MVARDWEDQSCKAMMIRLSGNWLVLLNGSAHQIHFKLPANDWRIRLSTEETVTAPAGGELVSAARSVIVMCCSQ